MISKPRNLRETSILILIVLFLFAGNVYAQRTEEETFNQGIDYLNKYMYDEAISELTKVIQVNPNNVQAYQSRGNIYQIKGNLDQALADFNKAIEINPYDVNAYLSRGHVYQNKGNPDQALADFSKAIEINPKNAQVYKNRAFLYFSKKEYTKSWQDVHKAEALGSSVDSGFLKELQKSSKRKR